MANLTALDFVLIWIVFWLAAGFLKHVASSLFFLAAVGAAGAMALWNLRL